MAPHACSIDRADVPTSGGRSGGRVKLLHLALAVMRKPQSGGRSSEWNLMTQLDAGTHTTGLPCKPGPRNPEAFGGRVSWPTGLRDGVVLSASGYDASRGANKPLVLLHTRAASALNSCHDCQSGVSPGQVLQANGELRRVAREGLRACCQRLGSIRVHLSALSPRKPAGLPSWQGLLTAWLHDWVQVPRPPPKHYDLDTELKNNARPKHFNPVRIVSRIFSKPVTHSWRPCLGRGTCSPPR